MPKPKLPQPIIQSNERRMLALNNAGVNELAIYIGSTNWFAEELVRSGMIPHVTMGDRKVVDSKDVDVWLLLFKSSEAYRQAWMKFKEEHPDLAVEAPTSLGMPFVNREEAKIFFEHLHKQEWEALKAKMGKGEE
jgi:hypothetical protein